MALSSSAVVVSAGTLARRHRPLLAPLAGALAVALSVVHALWVVRQPVPDLVLAGLAAFAFFPRVARGALVGVVALAPVFNPPLLGLGPNAGGTIVGGRVYLAQAVLLPVIVGGLVYAARQGMLVESAAVVALVGLFVAVQTVGRPDAGAAWVYRPLQLLLVAYAVRALFTTAGHRILLLAMAWGAALGCTLASAHALVPSFDPFARSRPDNVPFVSAISGFARATGAFTYPNNLGTFAAYTVLLGTVALVFGRPALPRHLARLLVGSGTAALLLSGSRAAGVGLLCGMLYVTVKLAPQRRALILLVQGAVGVAVILAVLSSPSALDVARERIDSASGLSLTLRIEGSRDALDAFTGSPVIGTGATESRTDNSWLLYLSQAGLVGAALFLVLARTVLRPGRGTKAYPELLAATVITIVTSGLLQDTLGQTLTSWFPGVLLGLSAVAAWPSRDRALPGH